MFAIVGSCPQCGAPIYAAMIHVNILPPPNTYSCGCMPRNIKIITVTNMKESGGFTY